MSFDAGMPVGSPALEQQLRPPPEERQHASGFQSLRRWRTGSLLVPFRHRRRLRWQKPHLTNQPAPFQLSQGLRVPHLN